MSDLYSSKGNCVFNINFQSSRVEKVHINFQKIISTAFFLVPNKWAFVGGLKSQIPDNGKGKNNNFDGNDFLFNLLKAVRKCKSYARFMSLIFKTRSAFIIYAKGSYEYLA